MSPWIYSKRSSREISFKT